MKEMMNNVIAIIEESIDKPDHMMERLNEAANLCVENNIVFDNESRASLSGLKLRAYIRGLPQVAETIDAMFRLSKTLESCRAA